MTEQTTPQGVTLLKELLFDRETKRLEEMGRKIEVQAQHALMRDRELTGRVEEIYARAGSDEKLQHSVAGIIDGALREAEVAKHEDLSRAIAPLVVRTIKHELRSNQDEMIDALYPITGRLVKSYVQSAINDMMVEINAKLGGGRPAKLIERSAATGVAVGDLALAEANKLRVEELFLVRRGSGELVAHWRRPILAQTGEALPAAAERPGTDNRDLLFSGYLTSIMSLSEETFGAAPGSFRTLALESGDRIFVRGSAGHLLAVRCSGTASAPVEKVIDEVFLDTLERYQTVLAAETARQVSEAGTTTRVPLPSAAGDPVAAILPKVGSTIESLAAERAATLMRQQIAAQSATKPSFLRLYIMATIVAAPFVAWGLWSAYVSYQTGLTETAAQHVLEATEDIKGVPPKIEVARGGRSLTLSGFVPTLAQRDQILARLAADVPQAVVHNQLAVLPEGSGPAEIAIAELQRRWARAREAAEIDAVIVRPIERARLHLSPLRESIGRLSAQVGSDPAMSTTLAAASHALDEATVALDRAHPLLAGATLADPALAAPLATAWQKLLFAESQIAALLGGSAPVEKSLADAPLEVSRLAEDVAMTAERLSAVELGLTQAVALHAVPQKIAALTAKVDHLRSAREAFEQQVRSSIIFFENGTDLKDAAQATKTVDELARSLRAEPELVLRVVGFTDEKGSTTLNTNLAQARATAIATLLADRGVAARQIIAIGRQQAKDLSTARGPGNPNRRVEFEIGFPGEAGDR